MSALSSHLNNIKMPTAINKKKGAPKGELTLRTSVITHGSKGELALFYLVHTGLSDIAISPIVGCMLFNFSGDCDVFKLFNLRNISYINRTNINKSYYTKL